MAIFILLLTIAQYSCTSGETNQLQNATKVENSAQLKIIADAEFWKYRLGKKTEELNLAPLKPGKDSLEIRFWIIHSVMIPGSGNQVYIIKKLYGDWHCFNYHYFPSRTKIKGDVSGFKLDSFWVVKKQPLNGWDSFLSGIKSRGIFELPDQADIPNWKLNHHDGTSYLVEFSQFSAHRQYAYSAPEIYSLQFPDCERMHILVKYIDSAFNNGKGYFWQ